MTFATAGLVDVVNICAVLYAVDQRGDGQPAASRSFFAFFLIVIITHK